jgi:hypothetical protein
MAKQVWLCFSHPSSKSQVNTCHQVQPDLPHPRALGTAVGLDDERSVLVTIGLGPVDTESEVPYARNPVLIESLPISRPQPDAMLLSDSGTRFTPRNPDQAFPAQNFLTLVHRGIRDYATFRMLHDRWKRRHGYIFSSRRMLLNWLNYCQRLRGKEKKS